MKGSIVMALTKREIVEYICENTGMTKKECISAVEATFGIIKEELTGGNDVKISGFGKWSVKHKGERNGRNPQTGEPLKIRSRKVITFSASEILKSGINEEVA